MYEYDRCIKIHSNACAPHIHRGMVCFYRVSFCKSSFIFKLKTLLESYSEAHDDFIEALNISPINLRAKYQKLINDAKIGNKEKKPERVEQALASFEEYYDTCKQDIYYALALISVNKLI
jgi:tetratricopeptide (TPR) repeat protein